MAYYDALIAAWNSVTQPPTGVTGSGLSAGDTTQQKCAKINAWTMVSSAQRMTIAAYDLYNLILPSEFDALSPTNSQIVRDMLGMVQVDCSPGSNTRVRLNTLFPAGTQTHTNFLNFAKNFDTPVQDWCFTNGYPTHGVSGPGNISVADANNAGLV
jgi:hypothetical protein